MSYENAVPKPLKFLISDGKMIDDEGNVIAESETLKDLYTKWNPEVKKYLLSDGSVVDEEGNLIVKNDYYKKIYDQADPKVAKYLHSDGTVDENPGGGSADLENNHQTTIDVSTYTEPVEVTPTQGKDGMKKVTVSLSNIPAGANMLYAWEEDGKDPNTFYFGFEVAPTTLAEFQTKKILYGGELGVIQEETCENASDFERTSDTEFSVNISGGGATNFTRNPTYDINVGAE